MFSRVVATAGAAAIVLAGCSGGANQEPVTSLPSSPQVAARLDAAGASQTRAATPADTLQSNGYTLSVFARGTSAWSKPDAIVSEDGWTYVAYQNATTATGGGGNSTIVKYGSGGKVAKSIDLPGRIDGMRFNPYRGEMWVTVNEDANPHLYTIDLISWVIHRYEFSAATHGGGYDDLAFSNGKAFIAASNPNVNAQGINDHPAVVSVALEGTTARVTSVLAGNSQATDAATGKRATLNLTDPDSMTVAPNGDIVLISQADQEIVRIHDAGTSGQSVTRLLTSQPLDDTQFALESDGLFYVVDSGTNTIYIMRGQIQTGAIYTQTPNSIAIVNPSNGALSNVVTGLSNPTGLLFVSDRDTALK